VEVIMGYVNPNRLGIVVAVVLSGWHAMWEGLVAAVLWNCLGAVCSTGKASALPRS